VKASTKSSRDLIWDALTSDGKLKSELRDATGVSDEQVDRAIKELQKAGKVTTSGKARGTRYARAGGSSQAEVRA
jgi:biotin operon repressor